ncbi:protein secretion protein [Lentibacillus cibarius]|uniref:peptidylprolyl isomerase n=1 Tax=Lentibacillus cibarius TaxID=2583219 RepID=A0A549YGX8_9BACI|nr:peptidyl-prolyl cis-trans isomerase [Lentibacillus cibarius]TRM11134.1 protein secretion protein [Lentibacillus cibarius]
MNRKLLWGMLVVLLVTNIATLIVLNQNKNVRLNSSTAINKSEPAAVIGDNEIPYDEWIASLREDYGKAQLKKMINHEVVQQLAKKHDIDISEKVIAREMSLLTTTQGVMTDKTLSRKEKKWRKDILYRYQLEALLTSDVQIPEEKVRTYYNKYRNQYDFKSSMQLSHIVVNDLKTAEKIRDKLKDGAQFDLLAEKYSIDKDTKHDGGYLGFFVDASPSIPASYLTVAVDMKERTYSEPIRRADGVAIIFLHRKLPSIAFTYQEIKPYVERELAMDELDQSPSAASLWNELKVEWVYDN